MRHSGTTFFVDDTGPLYDPVVHIDYPDKNYGWPISCSIGTQINREKVIIHFKSESQYIKFVSSINQSYNKFRKGKGYVR